MRYKVRVQESGEDWKETYVVEARSKSAALKAGQRLAAKERDIAPWAFDIPMVEGVA